VWALPTSSIDLYCGIDSFLTTQISWRQLTGVITLGTGSTTDTTGTLAEPSISLPATSFTSIPSLLGGVPESSRGERILKVSVAEETSEMTKYMKRSYKMNFSTISLL